MTEMQLLVRHQLNRHQLVNALAVMTACTQDHAVIPRDELTGEHLVSQLVRHVARFGSEGKPTHPLREHIAWAENVAADLVAPLLTPPPEPIDLIELQSRIFTPATR
jgi:hypothetical protein